MNPKYLKYIYMDMDMDIDMDMDMALGKAFELFIYDNGCRVLQ